MFLAVIMMFNFNFVNAQENGDKAQYLEIKNNKDLLSNSLNSADLSTEVVNGNFTNGGFEAADFSGWVFGDTGGGLTPWTVCITACDWFANSTPLEGTYDALNGFDGPLNYSAFLYQDIQIPAEGGTLSFFDRIQYDSLGIPSSLPRIYEVQLRDPVNNSILDVLLHQEIMLNGQSYTDLGWQPRGFDLNPYATQTIRVYISLLVPEDFTGPASIEFDDFFLIPNPGPPGPEPSPNPTPSSSNLRVSPPSGSYFTTQTIDLSLILETDNLSVVGLSAILDGNDISSGLDNCNVPGVLIAGGQTFTCNNVSFDSNHFGPGEHVLTVTINLSDGSSVSDVVLWKIIENSEGL